MGSSQTRGRTRVPCIGRQILNHCATREAQNKVLLRGDSDNFFLNAVSLNTIFIQREAIISEMGSDDFKDITILLKVSNSKSTGNLGTKMIEHIFFISIQTILFSC